jgi:hypothetical protein
LDENMDELLARLKRDIESANRYYEDEIEKMLVERNQIYDADKEYYRQKYPDLSDVSDIVTTDLSDVVEWSMPALAKAYFGSSEIVSIRGMTEEDTASARVMEALVNYQLMRLNKPSFFVVCYDWIKRAFVENASFVKCYWERETRRDKMITDIVGAEQLELLKSSNLIELISAEPVPEAIDLYTVEYITLQLLKNQPRIVNIPASEVRFSPDANDLDECNFIAHRKIVTVDYLRKMEREGVFQNVDEVVENLGKVKFTESELRNNPDMETYSRNEHQIARKKVELYECYVKVDLDGDQILEDWIITVANNVIVRQEQNNYGRHPFFMLALVRDPGRIWPKKGLSKFVSEIQTLKTGFIRQIINNTALNNDLPAFIDENRVNALDVIQKKKAIRVIGSPRDAISYPPLQPMAPWTMQFLEYLENAKEQATGISRYWQGTDSNMGTLNKTATGVSILSENASQRIELYARILLETGLTPLFRFLISMNQRFIDQPQVVRLTNEPLIIRPDDLQGNFDLEINAALGVGTKQTEMQNMQLLLGLYPNLFQIGLATPMNVYNTVKKMLETMGYRNTTDFITQPGGMMFGPGVGGPPAGPMPAGAGGGNGAPVQPGPIPANAPGAVPPARG